jgi:hypothetical protein
MRNESKMKKRGFWTEGTETLPMIERTSSGTYNGTMREEMVGLGDEGTSQQKTSTVGTNTRL